MSMKAVLREDVWRGIIRLFLLLAVGMAVAFMIGGAVSARQMEAGLVARESAVAGRLIASRAADADTVADAFTAKRISAQEQALGTQVFVARGYRAETAGLLAPFFSMTYRQFIGAYGILFLLALFLFAGYVLIKLAHVYACIDRLAGQAAEIGRGNFALRPERILEGALGRMQDALREVALGVQNRLEKLEKNRKFLKDLTSDISHQLKTPLAALKMYQEILTQEPMGADARSFVTGSGEQIERMEWLVLGLLKMARVEAGQLTLHLCPEDPDVLCRQVAADFTRMASEKGVDVVCVSDCKATLLCDAAWLREAVGNVVKNCIECTPPGGRITLETEETPVACILTVRDTGPGIHPADLPFLFRRFYRGHGRSEKGSGIGLPLARSITEQMGGTLSAGGIYGQGAVFTFTFLHQSI
ncbi:sensor histidine kinase [Ethanoligenens harbinense]|uniref:histidine kinase n=1 Tax=Ethanoligenens harbinense (strain DSM 18485 / JCM 12961 / CGMCC 1.5033 / YUAN-3) TaxID=663278 RepID=E6U489_ETHHY|nr:HAMP domain-containing sensor histidine kinase [Ethanoligenens harbinense]ADU26589.1 integral membrane sensor signal transduction histidine kinase [Ethanoligenens harbinense YUAN-3]AVQ95714.1 sensor histidine kinase [Ethanoligenens harbinense YUAN-3]AYF38377.1 sensor histidine kinase [Ethanoligenens harbinense]AYF41121.1 sensor histidine kinase [Ethanoligenens harbinense]QCN91953.1 sensor histidine kinase [Ethanoligenens harbinense]